ncbi:hypothetical protein F1721_12450 [Saccharopolyspora hirsuta]|uniref:Uncharacterized protein n=1 Tax=Saccharopolyspora hirsuta TaxID=1837 RepID=A0A5M7BXG1_SACHI|nr:hypothetical protein F1721_12450 [Saccharopolyspora hirsuta]
MPPCAGRHVHLGRLSSRPHADGAARPQRHRPGPRPRPRRRTRPGRRIPPVHHRFPGCRPAAARPARDRPPSPAPPRACSPAAPGRRWARPPS